MAMRGTHIIKGNAWGEGGKGRAKAGDDYSRIKINKY